MKLGIVGTGNVGNAIALAAVTRGSARKIVAVFGERTLRVIDESPTFLKEVKGIGPKRLQLIRESWREQKAVRDIMAILARGERPTKELRLRTKRNAAYACQLALAAVQRLFNAAGGHALFAEGAIFVLGAGAMAEQTAS